MQVLVLCPGAVLPISTCGVTGTAPRLVRGLNGLTCAMFLRVPGTYSHQAARIPGLGQRLNGVLDRVIICC